MFSLRPDLRELVGVDGSVWAHVTYDLTVYLPEATTGQLEFLLGWYQKLCPSDRLTFYATTETMTWDRVADPNLTKQGRAAAALETPFPFVAPVRTRVSNRRPFQLLFWDGKAQESFQFSYRQLVDDQDVRHTFVRIIVPLATDPNVLVHAAEELVDRIEYLSGHGGLCFAYSPAHKFDAFTWVYPRARRYWAIDVEDLNGTVPLMKEHIKGLSWLTLLGSRYLETDAWRQAVQVAGAEPLVRLKCLANGALLQVGSEPVAGDRNRPSPEVEAMIRLGSALSPLIVPSHPALSGHGFIDHGNSNMWFHRFDDPSGWS